MLEFRGVLSLPYVHLGHFLFALLKMALKCLVSELLQQLLCGAYKPTGEVLPLYKVVLVKVCFQKNRETSNFR